MAIEVDEENLHAESTYNETKEDLSSKTMNGIKRLDENENKNLKEEFKFSENWLKRKDLKWNMIIFLPLYHAIAIYTLFRLPYTITSHWKTLLWNIVIIPINSIGVTAGAHRLWSHRAYKANAIVRSFLMICFLSTGLNSVHEWVKNHRLHHKYSDTDGDPHNSTRGFFYSHCGWIMMKKHPSIIENSKKVDISDLEADHIVVFAEKHFLLLRAVLAFAMPILLPVYFWNEDYYTSFSYHVVRHVFIFNAVWSINSWNHMYGTKPYDRNIAPVDNKLTAYITFGEGWHNYHHAFPWDYRAAEVGGGRFNPATAVIDFFAKLGWTYDLKEPSKDMINKYINSRGDGSHESLRSNTITTKDDGNTKYE